MNIFNTKHKEGTNLDMLRAANEFYTARRGMTMARYVYADTPSKKVDLAILKDRDLRCCDICGARLYESEIERNSEGASYSAINQKKHMVFFNAAGQASYTCYSVKRCLKRVEYDVDEDLSTPINGPCFDEFIDLLEISVPDNEGLYISVKEDFDLKVKPFVDKWLVTNPTKQNIADFIHEYFQAMRHLDFYEDKDHRLIERAIMNLIGISPRTGGH